MSEEESQRIAKSVDRIAARVAPLVASEDHLPAALALTKLAAEHVYHDTAKKEDFLTVCEAAWSAIEEVHASGSCTH